MVALPPSGRATAPSGLVFLGSSLGDSHLLEYCVEPEEDEEGASGLAEEEPLPSPHSKRMKLEEGGQAAPGIGAEAGLLQGLEASDLDWGAAQEKGAVQVRVGWACPAGWLPGPLCLSHPSRA